MVATAVMSVVASAPHRFESRAKKKRQEELRSEPPYTTMARRIVQDVLHRKVSDETLSLLGEVLHWLYGAGWGAAYGVLRRRRRGIGAAIV